MDRGELKSVVGLVLLFFVLSVSVLIFAAYIISVHEQTVRACIDSGQSWTNDSCISVIK